MGSLKRLSAGGDQAKMFKLLKKLWRDRRGNALMIAGAALPLVIGSAGLASDTIQWVLWKRELQRAADSAAMAGVYAKIAGQAVGTCSDIAGATYAQPVAWDLKKDNHVGMVTSCTVTNPPTTGSWSADTNAVKVDLSVQRQLGFSGLFLSTAPIIRASATATKVSAGDSCVLALESTTTVGITVSGGAQLNLGCGIATNSANSTKAIDPSGSAVITANPVSAVGGLPGGTYWGTGTVKHPFAPAQADPFASLPNPDFPATPCPSVTVPNGGTLSPSDGTLNGDGYGCFSGISFGGSATLNPGIYIMDAADFTVPGGTSVTCNGCTIILSSRTAATTPNSIHRLTISGSATVNLVAPSSGTYQGILIYQDRRVPAGGSQSSLSGSSSSKLQGAIYMPNEQLSFTGGSTTDTNCLQLIARNLTFSGNMNVNNSCPAGYGNQVGGTKVRLVA